MIKLSTRADDDPVLASEFRKEFSDSYPKKTGTSNKDYRKMQEDYVSTRIAEIVLREGNDSDLADLTKENRHSLLLDPSIDPTRSKVSELRPFDEFVTLRMIYDKNLRETIDLTLRNAYQTDDSRERRTRAGEILGYSKLRTAFHELLLRKR